MIKHLGRLLIILGVACTALTTSYATNKKESFNQTQHFIQSYRLSAKVIYLDFWASWCPPCLKSFPWMNKIHEKYKDQGLQIVAVNEDNEQSAADAFLVSNPAQFKIIYDSDGKIASAFQLKGMPHSFLIDQSGKIRYSHIGFRNKDTAGIEREIERLLGEEHGEKK